MHETVTRGELGACSLLQRVATTTRLQLLTRLSSKDSTSDGIPAIAELLQENDMHVGDLKARNCRNDLLVSPAA
jgi:hypothetical protein